MSRSRLPPLRDLTGCGTPSIALSPLDLLFRPSDLEDRGRDVMIRYLRSSPSVLGYYDWISLFPFVSPVFLFIPSTLFIQFFVQFFNYLSPPQTSFLRRYTSCNRPRIRAAATSMASLNLVFFITLISSLLSFVSATDSYLPSPPSYTPPSIVTDPPIIVPTISIPPILPPLPTTSLDGVTIPVTVNSCATPLISISLITSLHVSTVHYVTTETIVLSITQSLCPPPVPTYGPTTCVPGTPVTTGGYTITFSEVKPTNNLSGYLPNLLWETGTGGHLIGSQVCFISHIISCSLSSGFDCFTLHDILMKIADSHLQEFSFGKDFQAFAEYKCQFNCGPGCESWFVIYSLSPPITKCNERDTD